MEKRVQNSRKSLETANTVALWSQNALDFSRHYLGPRKRLCALSNPTGQTILRIAFISIERQHRPQASHAELRQDRHFGIPIVHLQRTGLLKKAEKMPDSVTLVSLANSVLGS